MSTGILILRVVVGLVVAAHGSQKLFGWFGGGGVEGTGGFFGQQLSYRAPTLMAVLAGIGELGGGLGLALGFLVPVAALGIAVVMLNAIVAVHWPNGLFASNGGYELPLTNLTAALTVTAAGPQRFSLDRLIGWDGSISGPLWALAVLDAALVIAWTTAVIGRAPRMREVPAH